MRQQEDFRTPGGGANTPAAADGAPFFDEQSALKAAPVVPLERVARRERLARLAGGWRETVRTPQFRRSWPLALLLVATLAAAVAATNIYTDDAARSVTRTTGAAAAANSADADATADAQKTAAPPARDEADHSLQARDERRGRGDKAATVGNSEAFAASALSGFPGDDGDARDVQGDDAAASGRDERGGERDRGKRQKRTKRRHGAKRNGGGAILFDVIR